MTKGRSIFVSGLWLLLVASTMSFLAAYTNLPGASGAAPRRWPSDSRIAHDSSRATLLLLAHPHCPCTSATLGELALLMANTHGKAKAYVIFSQPAGLPVDWAQGDLWQAASAIPGVTVAVDEGNVEARRFHVETSGELLLYGTDGRLLFEGGITLSRGHSGDNPGRTAVASLLNRGSADEIKTPVFGCPLFGTDCPAQEMK